MLEFSLFLIFSFLIIGASGGLNCDACYIYCRFLDFSCCSMRHDCEHAVSRFDHRARHVNHTCTVERVDMREIGQDIINASIALLVNKSIYTQEFVDSVQVYYCKNLHKYNIFGFPAMEDYIWIDDISLDQPATVVATQLSHQYYYVKQWCALGDTVFKCQYAAEAINRLRRRRSNSKFTIEENAQLMETTTEECLVNHTSCLYYS